MGRRLISFDDDDLSQFSPEVQEALTRLDYQQNQAHRAPSTPGGFTITDRGVTDRERESMLRERKGRVPHLAEPSNYNPILPEDER